jgi:hypothetical protein
MPKARRFYIIATVLLFLIELFIALYIHDDFIRPYFGDFLVVILLYCFMRAVFNFSVLRTAMLVLIFSYIIETLQYFKLVEILNLQEYKIARVVIGTSFAWVDLLAYTLGIILVLLIEILVQNKRQFNN